MVRVLVCDQVEIDRLGLGEGFEVDYRPGLNRDELLRVVGEYEVLIVRSRTRVDKELLERASRLRLVARPGTGLDNIDVGYAKSKGVEVSNSPESLVEAVAEQVTLLMLALSRNLTVADRTTRAGLWKKEEMKGTELKGKNLGIVGLGRIGRRIAEIGGVFGMGILAYDVVPIPDDVVTKLGCRVVSLAELFVTSDYVTLHVPLTDSTMHLVDAKLLSTMKKRSFLVNTSRGGVIDERALIQALKDGSIAGAALDVFESEPPAGEILSAPNTILTPHLGGQTAEAQGSAIAAVGEKVSQFFGKR